jgi:Peptidase inhibitor I78 family
MMQFRMVLASLGALGVSGCNPWFDYAPKGTVPNSTSTGHDPVSNPQSCPAKDLQYLVGQPRTVLQTMRFGSEVRFEEPGQAYTQEFVATRTRIIIGPDSYIVRVLCG